MQPSNVIHAVGPNYGNVKYRGNESDGDIKLKFQNRNTSSYIKAATLLVPTAEEVAGSLVWMEGDYAVFEGRTGQLTMSPDSDNDIKIRWDDTGEESVTIQGNNL